MKTFDDGLKALQGTRAVLISQDDLEGLRGLLRAAKEFEADYKDAKRGNGVLVRENDRLRNRPSLGDFTGAVCMTPFQL